MTGINKHFPLFPSTNRLLTRARGLKAVKVNQPVYIAHSGQQYGITLNNFCCSWQNTS